MNKKLIVLFFAVFPCQLFAQEIIASGTDYLSADNNIRVKIYDTTSKDVGNIFRSKSVEMVRVYISYPGGGKMFDNYSEKHYSYNSTGEKIHRFLTYRSGDYFLKIKEPLGGDRIYIYTNLTRALQEITLYKYIPEQQSREWYE